MVYYGVHADVVYLRGGFESRRWLHMRVLVLNADYTPIHVISEKRALVLLLLDRVDMVEPSETVYRSEFVEAVVPSIIRLREYKNVPYYRKVALTNAAVLRRDNRECCYCGGKANTVDHVYPRSKGGRNSWENVVASCKECNSRKGDKLLSDLGWEMRFKPYVPQGSANFARLAADIRKEWLPYFEAFNKK